MLSVFYRVSLSHFIYSQNVTKTFSISEATKGVIRLMELCISGYCIIMNQIYCIVCCFRMKISIKSIDNQLFCQTKRAPHTRLSRNRQTHMRVFVVPDNRGIVTLLSRLLSVLSLDVKTRQPPRGRQKEDVVESGSGVRPFCLFLSLCPSQGHLSKHLHQDPFTG